MTLISGARLGPYEIISPIGAGGMGEVYRARDSKLGREIAIKVLPDAFTKDPERLARFEREARLLASLNHPNIGAIHGLEESDGTHFLVLELVPGETLAERIHQSRDRQGADIGSTLEIEEALTICSQIAEALEAAHEKGIIHRDLKPANVKVTPEGKVKVLDFGLAKAFAADESSPSLSMSPTLTAASVQSGVILGTAAYMSPEQARGKPLDKRTDIWSFGCVLYETLSGRQAFRGETVSDTLAAILRGDPDWQALPKNTPANIQILLRRCLKKDPNHRLRDVGDARIEIKESLDSGTAWQTIIDAGVVKKESRERVAWAVTGVLFLATVLSLAALAWMLRVYHGTSEAEPIRFNVSPPEKASFKAGLAVSPDGRHLAFIATDLKGTDLLWVRGLDSLVSKPLPATEGASYPFWSPDSRFIGFFAQGKLKKIEISGGPAQTLCDATDGRGGTWNREGTIILAPNRVDVLYRVPASGGMPEPVTKLDPSRKEQSHRWPHFLPDGRHFLYLVTAATAEGRGIYAASLDSTDNRRLLGDVSVPAYASPGYLLFVRNGTLMAEQFDAEHLQVKGETFPAAEQVFYSPPVGAPFAISQKGVLAYRSGNIENRQLTWFERNGKRIGTIAAPGLYFQPALAPDEKRIAVQLFDSARGTSDIWLIELSRSVASRFTLDPVGALDPVWSPDGRQIAFSSGREGLPNLYRKLFGGAEELLFKSNNTKNLSDWSSDGRFIVFQNLAPKTNWDLWLLPLFGDRRPTLYLETPFNEGQGQLSPDMRWMAYTSDESGANEVYVQPFPVSGNKWRISTHGGSQPKWRKDGKELFYIAADRKLMATPVKAGSTFEAGVPTPLFQTQIAASIDITGFDYVVTADGRRFLINTVSGETVPSPITVVVNWSAGLRR